MIAKNQSRRVGKVSTLSKGVIGISEIKSLLHTISDRPGRQGRQSPTPAESLRYGRGFPNVTKRISKLFLQSKSPVDRQPAKPLRSDVSDLRVTFRNSRDDYEKEKQQKEAIKVL